MARAISDEELQLKKRARRRLVGAVILVTAVAVILPMVLDSEPQTETRDIDIRIPSPESAALKPKAAPSAPAPEPAAGTSAAVPQSPPAEPAVAKRDVRPEPSPPKEKAAADPSPKKPAATPSNAKDEYVLQVIALSDADKAKQLQQRIASAGIKSYTEVVKTEKGDVTRVRVGPFTSREAAEKARGQLKSIGLDGKAVPR